MKRCFVWVFLASCGQEPPPPPPPAPPLPATGEVKVPEIAEENLIPLAPPPGDAALAWDFSPGRRYSYKLSQRVHQLIVASAGGGKNVLRAQDRNAGTVDVAGTRDRNAKATIKIKTEDSVVNGQAVPAEDVRKNPATRFECVLREDGTFADLKPVKGPSDPKLILDGLFALREGERGGPQAKFRTVRGGAFKVLRYECVRLVTDFELSSGEPNSASLLRGRTVAYFAWRERFFVRAETSIAKATRSRSLNEQGLWIVSAVDDETTVRVDYVE